MTVQPRHHHVEQKQVRGGQLSSPRECCFTVVHDDDVVVLGEHFSDHDADRWVVFGDQNTFLFNGFRHYGHSVRLITWKPKGVSTRLLTSPALSANAASAKGLTI